ncbi:hypothetical protein CF65_01551 [Aggregatibacter actinomycetemcomitans HK1651]|nr:hypothetical protein CF65_01551 [Aggregatibacter actinomycetemcomitans HK1651]
MLKAFNAIGAVICVIGKCPKCGNRITKIQGFGSIL